MIKRIMPSTIRGKIMLSTGAVTFLIAAITVSICFTVFQSFLRRSQIQSAEYNLQVVSHNVSTNMDDLLTFNKWCCSSTDIVRFLEGFQTEVRIPPISSDNAHLRFTALNAYNRLKEEYFKYNRYINNVLISPENCLNYFQVSNSAVSSIPRAASVVKDAPFFQTLLNAPDYEWIGLEPIPGPYTDPALCIPMIRPIYNQYNTEQTGWTYLSVSDQVIRDYLRAFPLEPDNLLYITIGDRSYLYQDNSFVEASPAYTVIKELQENVRSKDTKAQLVCLEDGSRRRIVTCPLWSQGWNISLVLSEQDYDAQNQVYILIIGSIVIAISIMGFMLAWLLNRTISQPVKKLREKIHLISEGDFSREPSIEWKDELGAIGRGINQMSENVSSLMDRRVEDEKQKKDLEYKILQSQINPHFLYNTLNSIKWMATIQNAPGIAEMTTSLARLMKNVSKGTDARITLREELDLVKDYFLIQQYRYGGSLSIEYDILSEDLNGCLIHRFTLQPLVENALFHGIEPKGCAGRIVIRAEKREDPGRNPLLVISITDNGIGMDQETIEKVLKGDTAPSADFFKQVGIDNVNRRIQYDFGPEYGIRIESIVGEYTTMIITLPYMVQEGI